MPKLPGLLYVRSGVSEGLSANRAYSQYQQAAADLAEQTGERWTASRRTVFLQQYSAVRAARAAVEPALTAPKDQPAGGMTPVQREATRPGGFLNWAVAFTRPIGSAEVERTFHPIRSNEPLTPQEMEERVREDIEESAGDAHGTFFRYTIEGIVWTGTEELIPES